ncbi:hypothetical protein FRC01_007799 [Tulasnella sp. 417]|nr:hypothetical protein FRC01_007799 [Tulasnella sp. 417]
MFTTTAKKAKQHAPDRAVAASFNDSFMQAANDNQAAHEAYILLLLSDANLPTGSFVASAGLESYIKHGFFSTSAQPDGTSPFSNLSQESSESDPTSVKDTPNPPRLTSATMRFLQDSVQSYARSALPFVGGVHDITEKVLSGSEGSDDLQDIMQLDSLYESMTLNHVARRASKAQGVALLTLYSKSHLGSRELKARYRKA